MTLQDNNFKNIPSYYPSMYLNGYTPEAILYARRKSMYERFRADTADDDFNFHITSEVKKK